MPVRGRGTMISAVSLLPLLLHSSRSSTRLCPGACQCYGSADLVDCKAAGLERVPPPDVPRSTWLLDLSGNVVREVRPRSFVGLWALRILILSNDSIDTLQPQAFSALQFLERLDLSFNRLRSLPPDLTRSLSSLLELRLDHNWLQQLDAFSLADSDNLRKLDLSHNRIHALDARAFHGLGRLRLLDLQGNRLSALGGALLSRQRALEVLQLAHNNISVIAAEALAPLRSLTLLSLRANQLERVKFKTFLQLRTASTHIQLARNPWVCDCDLQRVFGKIQRVRHLHVEDYEDIVCHAPPQQAGGCLAAMDSQLCMAETASVLVITITVMAAVVGALVKAERNRKSKQAASDAEAAEK